MTDTMNCTSPHDSRTKSSMQTALQKCSDCGESFDTKNRRAKYLPCLHTFCERCLVKQTRDRDLFACSECAMQVYVPSNGVKGFQENYFIMNQLEKYKKDPPVAVKKRRKLSCRRCNRNSPAEAWCVECGTFICMRCIRAHNEHPLVTHEVCHLSRLNSSMRRKVAQSRERCVHHLNEAVEYFCQTPGCNKPICWRCLQSDHRDHKVTSLTDLVTRYKEELQRLMLTVKEKEDMLQKQADNIQIEIKELTNSMNDTEKQIRDFYDECRQRINQQEQNSLSQLSDIRSFWSTSLSNQSADVTKTLSRMCAGSTFTANSMEYGSDVQIARSQPLMKARLQELSSADVTMGPQTISSIHFNCNKSAILNVVDDVIKNGSTIVASPVFPQNTLVSIPSALVHTDCVVTIEPRDKYGNKYDGLTDSDISTELSCDLFSKELIEHTLRRNGNGSFEVLYNPPYIGEHKLGLKMFGKDFEKKFSIRVHPFILHPQIGYKGELCYIIIETPNCMCTGTPHAIGIDDITAVRIKAPSGQNLSYKLRDCRDNTYSATFRPTEHGEHIADVSVKCKATFIAERKIAKINIVNRVESLLPPSRYAVRRSPILSPKTNGPRFNLKQSPKINQKPKNELISPLSSPFNTPPPGSPVLPRMPHKQRVSIVAFEEDIS